MSGTVLITGASSGIGAAVAERLAASGFEVFGTSRKPDRLHSGAPPIQWVAMDVCDDASVAAGVAEVIERAGGLDAVVCNAGYGIFGSVEEVTMAEARAQLETNFFGVLRTVRAALPHLRERGRGRIVVVGSLAGRSPIPFQAHYSASKAALDALVLALVNELHPHGVHVSLVEPGDINTPFNDATDFSRSESSVYADRIRRCRRVIEETLPKSPGPEVVAKAVHRALAARRPRTRYPVGPESWLVPLGRRLLPDRWVLRSIRSHFDL
jgi:NAD(P)-dependent dehydrogenase (short-subunit alcohol dehydrogenase family)